MHAHTLGFWHFRVHANRKMKQRHQDNSDFLYNPGIAKVEKQPGAEHCNTQVLCKARNEATEHKKEWTQPRLAMITFFVFVDNDESPIRARNSQTPGWGGKSGLLVTEGRQPMLQIHLLTVLNSLFLPTKKSHFATTKTRLHDGLTGTSATHP